MRIGLISDTHIRDGGPGLAPQVARAFAGVGLILHCGDLETLAILDRLEEIAPVRAVRGHGDPHESGGRLVEVSRVVEVEGVRIGMVHDLEWPGPPIAYREGLLLPPEPLGEVLRRKFGQVVEVVAFGDTHEEMVERHEGVLFVNPGSPTRPGLRHPAGSLGTVALLDVVAGRVQARIVRLDGAASEPSGLGRTKPL